MKLVRTFALAAAVALGANAAYAQGGSSGVNGSSGSQPVRESIYDVIRGNQGENVLLQGRSSGAEPPASELVVEQERRQGNGYNYYLDHPTQD